MEELKITKGKSVTIPKIVNRYIIMYYDVNLGWQSDMSVFTTPESGIQNFVERQNRYKNENIKYYKVIEVELEIPFVQ
jgi:hypothetical protein